MLGLENHSRVLSSRLIQDRRIAGSHEHAFACLIHVAFVGINTSHIITPMRRKRHGLHDLLAYMKWNRRHRHLLVAHLQCLYIYIFILNGRPVARSSSSVRCAGGPWSVSSEVKHLQMLLDVPSISSLIANLQKTRCTSRTASCPGFCKHFMRQVGSEKTHSLL